MNKKLIALFLAIICVFSLFVSCKKEAELIEHSYNDDGLLQAEDGTLYKYAPLSYEPVKQGEEYGIIKAALEEKLYRIGDIDPFLWLTMEFTGAGYVYYNANEITLPTLREMGIETVYICEEDVNTIAIAEIGGEGTKDRDADREIIASLIELITPEDGKTEMWPRADVNEVFRLKLYSPDWPAIYYSLTYAVCASGNFVYDKSSGICVEVGDLIESYIGEVD